MKTHIIAVILLLPVLAFAESGSVFDDLSMNSEILNMERKYAVYLPPDYESSQRSYPVLYLLHGGGDDHSGWIQLGEVKRIADKAIQSGKATAMIIVMPDASGEKRGFSNDVTGEWRYEDFFFEEFMPYVEKTYRIRSEKRYRAVSGLSMGGSGTFYYALHRPDLFSSACPLSTGGSLAPKEEAVERIRERETTDVPTELINQWYENHDVFELIKNIPEKQKKAVRWYIDCGDDDSNRTERNAMVHAAMRSNDIPHEFRIRDGSHNWTYWRQSMPEVLNFISIGFHRGTD
jgi:enterochelin esterase-like enzyme